MNSTASTIKMDSNVCKLTLLPGFIISYMVGIVSQDGQVLDMALNSYMYSVRQCETPPELVTHYQYSGQAE